MLSFNSFCFGQVSDINEELKNISKKLKSVEKFDGEMYEEGVKVSLQNDTIYIYNYRGNPVTKIFSEFHYFMKVSEIESVEYKKVEVGDHTTHLLSFDAVKSKPLFIFKYGSSEEIKAELKEGFMEGDLQNYISVVLPRINDIKTFQKLESVIKGLIE